MYILYMYCRTSEVHEIVYTCSVKEGGVRRMYSRSSTVYVLLSDISAHTIFFCVYGFVTTLFLTPKPYIRNTARSAVPVFVYISA